MSALDPSWEQDLRGAVTLLKESRQLPTPQMLDLVDAALRRVVKVRDAMIASVRSTPSLVLRAMLDQVNVALSTLASIQYPGALEHEHLDEVMNLLHKLLAESEPHVGTVMEPLRPSDEGISGTIQGGLGEQQTRRMESISETLPHS